MDGTRWGNEIERNDAQANVYQNITIRPKSSIFLGIEVDRLCPCVNMCTIICSNKNIPLIGIRHGGDGKFGSNGFFPSIFGLYDATDIKRITALLQRSLSQTFSFSDSTWYSTFIEFPRQCLNEAGTVHPSIDQVRSGFPLFRPMN